MGNFSWILIIPILLVLVVVHEFGHFFAARFFDVKVEEFGVGLPPRIVGKMYKGTLWSLNWIPLGGFARMKDENSGGDAPDSFQVKPAYARAIILLAGIVFNLVFAGLIFSLTFALHGSPTGSTKALVGGVVADSPAQAAGWQPGDQILSIAGQPISNPDELRTAVNKNLGTPVAVELLRGTKSVLTTVTPRANPPEKQGALGITVNTEAIYTRVPIWQAIPQGFAEVGTGIVAIVGGLVGLFTQVIHGTGNASENLSGPIGIAQAVGEAVQTATIPAWVVVARLTAFISINLAIFNLLPIPALDGGRLVFVVLEMLRRGKRVAPEREGMVHLVGMALLLTLFVLVAFLDVQRIIDGRSILPR